MFEGYDFSKLEQVFHYMNQDGASCDGTWIEENIFPSKYKSRGKVVQFFYIRLCSPSLHKIEK